MKVLKTVLCMALLWSMTTGMIMAQDAQPVEQQEKDFGTRVEYPDDQFSIMFPYGWKTSDIHKENVVVAAFSPPNMTTGVSANVVVAATPLANDGEDLDSRFSTIMKELTDLGEMCSINDTGALTINDMPARSIVYTQTMEEHQFLARIVVLVENGMEYRIGSFSTPDTYETFKKYFFDIEKSFMLMPTEESAE